MSCDKNCQRIVTGGVAFGAGISHTASQSSYVAGKEAALQGLNRLVSKALAGPTSDMPFANLPKTRLAPSRVRLMLDAPDVNQPTGVILQSGYVVLRATGRETGLAVIPGLKRRQSTDGSDLFQEDTSEWWVLHIDSGRTVSSRGYKTPEQAQMLASALARWRDWTLDANELTAGDLKTARAVIDLFDAAIE